MSKTLTIQGHPCLVVEEIAARRGRDLIFTYSRYRIAQPGQQAKAPRSVALRVAAQNLTPEWLMDRFAELGPNEELAWHSWVESKGVVFHIPMIDFVNHPSYLSLCEVNRALTTEMDLVGDFAFFQTGSSFHGYFPGLITEQDWLKYLGQLLLLNEHEEQHVIDTRWVGHAIVRGFSALRWSHNTNRYQAMPRLLDSCGA